MTPEQKELVRKNIQFFLLLTGLFTLLLTYNHCGLDPSLGKKSNTLNRKVAANDIDQNSTTTLPSPLPNGSNTPAADEIPADVEEVVANVVNIEVDVGVKDFEQILHSMSAVTGVGITEPIIQTTYNQLSPQLPNDNSIKSFMAANQVAITKLAAEFCDVLVNRAELRSVVWPQINFGQSPTQTLGTVGRQHLIERAINRFWGDGLLSANEFNEQSIILNELIEALLVDSPNNSATTRLVTKGICIGTLSSSGNLLF